MADLKARGKSTYTPPGKNNSNKIVDFQTNTFQTR